MNRVRAANDPGADTDLTTLYAELEQLRGTMGTTPQNFAGIQDAVRRARAAYDALPSKRRTTNDATAVLRANVDANRARGVLINDANRALWGEPYGRGAAARDAVAAANKAAHPAERGAALNALHASFWAARK